MMNIIVISRFRMSDTYPCGELSEIDGIMDLLIGKERRKSKVITMPDVLSDESSHDLMSRMKAMIQLMKMLKEGSFSSERFMVTALKQIASSRCSSKIRTDCDVIKRIEKVQMIVD